MDKCIGFIVGNGFVDVDHSQGKANECNDPQNDVYVGRIPLWKEEML